MNRTSDFKQKEVINMVDGKRLGFVSDIDVNLEEGKVEAIILPGNGRLLGILGKENEIIIPWEKVHKVGEDIILVNLDERTLRKYYE